MLSTHFRRNSVWRAFVCNASSLKTRHPQQSFELGKQTPLQLPPTRLDDAFCIPRVKHVSRRSTWRLHYSFITFWVPSQVVSMKIPLAELLARRSTRVELLLIVITSVGWRMVQGGVKKIRPLESGLTFAFELGGVLERVLSKNTFEWNSDSQYHRPVHAYSLSKLHA